MQCHIKADLKYAGSDPPQSLVSKATQCCFDSIQEINRQIDGTVRDSNVYSTIADKLRLRGVQRDKKQVMAQLKSLKSLYLKTKGHNYTSGMCCKLLSSKV